MLYISGAPQLIWQDDDDVPGPVEKIRASICEIAELYALKYSEDFKQLGSFVNGVWTMLTTVGPSGKEDLVRRSKLVQSARRKGSLVSWYQEH